MEHSWCMQVYDKFLYCTESITPLSLLHSVKIGIKLSYVLSAIIFYGVNQKPQNNCLAEKTAVKNLMILSILTRNMKENASMVWPTILWSGQFCRVRLKQRPGPACVCTFDICTYTPWRYVLFTWVLRE
jgi:hypothetical protein